MLWLMRVFYFLYATNKICSFGVCDCNSKVMTVVL